MGRLEKRFSVICGHFPRVRAVCKILAVISRNYGNENLRYVMHLRACEAFEGFRRAAFYVTTKHTVIGHHVMRPIDRTLTQIQILFQNLVGSFFSPHYNR